MKRKRAVIAIGGNSLIKRRDKQSVEDQYAALCETMDQVAEVVEQGWQIVITHGNGPQVGFILLRSEIARSVSGIHSVPLVSCVADTQGAIGYQIQQSLDNALVRRGLVEGPGHTVSLVTQSLVQADDPGFADPQKYIGEYYDDVQLASLQAQHPDWLLKKESSRGWRRVVPSPQPYGIVEIHAVETLLEAGFNVVTAGGGGIPVLQTSDGLRGIDAVIDKDLASALLANRIGAELLIISTSVEYVCLHYGTPEEQPLFHVSASALERAEDEGHFPPGTMGPKIKAALHFIRHGGREVIITSPDFLHAALRGETGTHITHDRAPLQPSGQTVRARTP